MDLCGDHRGSRVVLTAHHPSDVIAGAVVGVIGALLVRDWFAARGWALRSARRQSCPLLGPSLARIKGLPGACRPIRSGRRQASRYAGSGLQS